MKRKGESGWKICLEGGVELRLEDFFSLFSFGIVGTLQEVFMPLLQVCENFLTHGELSQQKALNGL